MKKYIYGILTLTFMTLTLSATSGTWTGGAGADNWSNSAKWSGLTFPNGGEDATFPANLGANVTIDVPITLGTLTVTGGGFETVNLVTESDFSVATAILIPNANTYLYFADGAANNDLGFPLAITSAAVNYIYVNDQTIGAAGTVTVTAGYLYLDNNDTLGNIPTVHLTGNSTLDIHTGIDPLVTNLILDAGTILNVRNGTATNFSTNISGAGRVSVFFDAAPVFTGTNSYTGGLSILGDATVTGTTTSIPSAGGVSSTGSLTFNQAVDGIYEGVISGTGTLSKTGVGILTLTGTNTYTGTTTVTAGTLIGTTSSIPSAGGVVNSASLTFNQAVDGIYAGVISGTGTFAKTGAGTLTLSNTNTYTGTTTVTAGTLSVTGSIGTSTLTTVEANTTLNGSGTVGGLTNNGTVQAGLVAGDTLTLSDAHDYLQVVGATFVSLITPTASSRLVIPGTATLAGTLSLNIGVGLYPAGTTFTVLTATGGVISPFDTLTETDVGKWQMRHNATNVEVFLPEPVVITPVPLASLRGNDRIVGNYMFLDPNFVFSNTDLTIVANAMVALSGQGFRDSLIQVSPLATAANPQVQFQSNLQMAVVLDRQFQQEVKDKRRDKANETESEDEKSAETESADKKSAPCYGIPKTGLFIEPIGVFYHQRQTGGDLTNTGQVAFDSYTYGAGMGWEQVLDGQFVIEGGLGYTHSNLHWHDNFGNSRWSTIYVAPFFGWFNERFFANFMVMGGFNFFKTDRTVAFGTINRNATSRYNSYDLLLRLNGGARIPFGNINWFQPEATLNYLTVFTEGYREKGASSINLQVRRNTTYIMQPSFRGKWIQEFKTKNFCYSPILYAGWLANIMLQPQTVSARFRDAPNRIFFNIEGYSGTVNQLILGAEFFVQKFNQFEITSSFEVDMLSHFEVYTGKIKFQWFF